VIPLRAFYAWPIVTPMMSKLLFILALFLPAAALAQPAPVTVFAASSLRGALDEAATSFAAPVSLSFGGSGTMARQIAAGAPADLVVLANPIWMAWLTQNGPPTMGDPVNLLSNTMVLIAPLSDTVQPDPANLAASLKTGRMAMGQRDAVPAGIYAREWLQNTGQWDALVPRLAETDNVRSALALVARGETPLGVVYRTDALAEPKVRVVHDIPADQHSPIIYPAASLTDAGTDFLSHLQSPQSRAIFARYGFAPVFP